MELASGLRQPVVTKDALPLELDSRGGRVCYDQGLANTKFRELLPRNLRVSREDMVGPEEPKLLSVKVPKDGATDIAGPCFIRLAALAGLVFVAAGGCVLTPPAGSAACAVTPLLPFCLAVALLQMLVFVDRCGCGVSPSFVFAVASFAASADVVSSSRRALFPASRAGAGQRLVGTVCRSVETPPLCGSRWCFDVGSPAGRGVGFWCGGAPFWCVGTPLMCFSLALSAARWLDRCGSLPVMAPRNPLPGMGRVNLAEPRGVGYLLVLRWKHASVVIGSQDEGDALAFVIASCNSLFEARSPNASVPKLFAWLRIRGVAVSGVDLCSGFGRTCVGTPDDDGDAGAGAGCLDQVFIDPVGFLAGLGQEIIEVFWGWLTCALVLTLHVVVDPGGFVVLAMFADVFHCFEA